MIRSKIEAKQVTKKDPKLITLAAKVFQQIVLNEPTVVKARLLQSGAQGDKVRRQAGGGPEGWCQHLSANNSTSPGCRYHNLIQI